MTDIAELSAAMAKAFAQIEGAVKGKVNPAFSRGNVISKYADLAAVIDAIKPHLLEHGLWFRQVMHASEGGVGVETVIHHSSGQSVSCGVLHVPASKQDAQGYGSAITYARRYSLMAAFAVPAEDDDGNAATTRQEPAQRPDAAESAQILAALREAALEGLDALQAKFRTLPGGRVKAAVWAEHGERLKEAAVKSGVAA